MKNAVSLPALAALCLLAAGCTHGGESLSLEQSVAVAPTASSGMMALASTGQTSRELMREAYNRPIAYLPPAAGRIEGVRVHSYADGLRQDITLAGGSVRTNHDSITVLARTDRRRTLDDQIPLYKPSETAIRSEIGSQFPHVAMQVVERESSNAYGPYGLALGRIGEAHCLYMWQWIDANRLPPDAGVTGPLSVRVRLCRAHTTFDDMAALTDHLVIGDAPIDSFAASEAIAPLSDEAAPRSNHVRPRKTHTAAHRPVRVVRRQDPGETLMPSQPPRLVAPLPAQPYAGQQAYASQPAYVSQPSYAQGVPAGNKLSSDLPSEAYLGPRAAKTY